MDNDTAVHVSEDSVCVGGIEEFAATIIYCLLQVNKVLTSTEN